MMRSALLGLVLSSCAAPYVSPSAATRTVKATALAPSVPPGNCPFLDGQLDTMPDHAQVWPACHVYTPVLKLAGRCPDAHPCMSPCESVSIDGGKPTTVISYTYDRDGRLFTSETRDVATNELLVSGTMSYPTARSWTEHWNTSESEGVVDDAGRLVERRWHVGDARFVQRYRYEGDRLVERDVVMADGTIVPGETCTYDAAGRLLSCRKFRYTYGAGPMPIEVESSGNKLGLRYDDKGRLSDIVEPSGLVRHFEYDERGRVVLERRGGSETRWRYECR